MSILDSNPNSVDINDVVAKQIISQTRQTYSNMVRAFNDGAKIFWDNPRGATPSGIAEKLGTNAVEVFQLHYALGSLIGNVKPDAIVPGLALIGQFTMNEDGTVTVIEPTPEPTPPPSGE